MATQSDVRSILGLPSAPPPSAPKPAPRLKKAKRPDGITRELYALIGDNAPTLALARPVMKERWKKTPRVAGWSRKEFKNEARKDDLRLRHWVKNGVEETGLSCSAFLP
jgi:DNA methyltransferase 1-associated protein 1